MHVEEKQTVLSSVEFSTVSQTGRLRGMCLPSHSESSDISGMRLGAVRRRCHGVHLPPLKCLGETCAQIGLHQGAGPVSGRDPAGPKQSLCGNDSLLDLQLCQMFKA